jgi:2-polyprenyl-6-methoxyphenol hydroxylase-like FAD-dependent oxidoreductase
VDSYQEGQEIADDVAEHAVVIGAGVAGVLAARVLADRFARVTLVERDDLSSPGPAFRAGIPQSPQGHALWGHGLAIIETLLPGTSGRLTDAGAHVLDAPGDFRWLSLTGWFPRGPGVSVLTCGRELTDWTLRQSLHDHAKVRILSGREVTGLLPTPDGTGVRGVRLRRYGNDHVETVPAAFVADASGRLSRCPDWLTGIGYPAPSVERYDARFGYSSRYYRMPVDNGRDWKALYVQACPVSPRGGVLMPIEGDRWLVTLLGCGDHIPPTGDEAFLDYAGSLRSDVLRRAIQEAEPLSSAIAFRSTANEWRHYESLPRWPHGLVVLGDAACRFNPVYGQGMTVAAMTAAALADSLRGLPTREIPRASRQIQRATSACSADAWAIATGEDLRYPWTRGAPAGMKVRMLHRYMSHVVAAGNDDPATCRTIFRVFSMTAPPNALLSPSAVARVLARWHLPTRPLTQTGTRI